MHSSYHLINLSLGVVQTWRELPQSLWFRMDQHGWRNDHDQLRAK